MAVRLALLLVWLVFPLAVQADGTTNLTRNRIATLIFQNECAGKEACLTSWNKGEEFASLGIGHFIWYPQGTSEKNKRFSESFPKLIHSMRQQGVVIPVWLDEDTGCPWPNRKSFNNAQNSPKMHDFRSFLIKTREFQVNFIQKRLRNALPLMFVHKSEQQRARIQQQFTRVAKSPMGMYALIDYVNFKGEGTNPKERYQERGWGLLQVLTEMHGELSGVDTITEFVRAADMLLSRRVALSPPERHESRWLAGWRKRLRTYISESQNAYVVSP